MRIERSARLTDPVSMKQVTQSKARMPSAGAPHLQIRRGASLKALSL
jgi:hypothetical protein